MVRNRIFFVPQFRLGPGYVHIKFDLNLNSFAIPFGRSAVGLVKMAAPSRVLAKTKPKKWVKYYKVCNFIADLSFRNVMGDFRIKLFKKTLCLGSKIVI